MMAVGAYLALGLVVLASRLLFPKTKTVPAENASAPVAPACAANSETEAKLAA
jgi:hypothetical protein